MSAKRPSRTASPFPTSLIAWVSEHAPDTFDLHYRNGKIYQCRATIDTTDTDQWQNDLRSRVIQLGPGYFRAVAGDVFFPWQYDEPSSVERMPDPPVCCSKCGRPFGPDPALMSIISAQGGALEKAYDVVHTMADDMSGLNRSAAELVSQQAKGVGNLIGDLLHGTRRLAANMGEPTTAAAPAASVEQDAKGMLGEVLGGLVKQISGNLSGTAEASSLAAVRDGVIETLSLARARELAKTHPSVADLLLAADEREIAASIKYLHKEGTSVLGALSGSEKMALTPAYQRAVAALEAYEKAHGIVTID